MSGNKLLFVGLLCALAGFMPAASSAGPLVDELANAQIEKQLKEAKGEDKPKQATPVVLPSNLPRSTDSGKKLTLVAVYGLGSRLMADIESQGAIFTVKPEDVVDGWRVAKIWPSRVIMEKRGQKKPRELTLAVRPAELTTSPSSGARPASGPGMVPPPPPVN